MAEIGKPISTAFRYAFSPQRIAPFFALNLVIAASLLGILFYVIEMLPSFSMSLFFSLIGLIAAFVIVFIVVFLVKLFFLGVITDNSKLFYQKKVLPLRKSYPIAKSKYLSMLGAFLLMGIIVFVVGIIPLIGFIFVIVLSWMFLFVMQFVLINNEKAVDSLKKSYEFFMNNKLDVFVFWLIITLIDIALTIIVFIPVIIALLSIAPVVMGAALSGNFVSLFSIIKSNIALFAIAGIISALLFSYKEVWKQSALTFYFLQFKKK
ncbi:MAG TPA: hypothetical protein VJB11_00165 [archaeon]|nr:hypothetical protein [archaeon]